MITEDQVEKLQQFAFNYLISEETAEEFLKDYEDSKWVIYDKNNTATLPPLRDNSTEYSVDVLTEENVCLYYDYAYKEWCFTEESTKTNSPKKWKLLE